MRAFIFFLAVMTALSSAADQPTQQQAVLVTGANSGIGRAVTERLAAHGYFVYATARKEADLTALAAIKNVEAIKLDVTHPADIAAAVEKINKGGRGLYALVNNAGVAVAGPVLKTKEEDIRFLFDVNVYGPYRITQAFAPLVIASKGRITTIGSIAGTLPSSQLWVYSMSKHAIEAFSDALAEELAPQGVKVSVIEPGNYDSDIARNLVKRMGAPAAAGDRSQYKPPTEVAEAVEHALFDANPKMRYMVVPNEQEATLTISRALLRVAQQNADQPYSFDRKKMIEMLDVATQQASTKSGP